MHLRIACFVAWLAAAGSLPASAQDFNDPNSFSVNANFSIQAPLESKANTADMGKAIAQLSQQLGDLANRECGVLSDVFNAECHVTQLNIGTNINERRIRRLNGSDGEQQKIVNANVQATFALTPNAAAPKPAPTSTP